MENDIIISRAYLKNLIDSSSSKLVGKACKRMEILDDKESIKKEIKELIYESYRDFQDLLIVYCQGTEKIKWNFKSK